MLHALNPILENPRSGASASFVVHEIKTVIETCLQREMVCGSPPFRLSTPRLDIELGMVESGDAGRLGNLCGFEVPSLLGISPTTCLGYRCAAFKSNLMRNGSVDTLAWELAFRNQTQVLAPAFRSRAVNFTLPLSAEFSRRVQKGGRPQCVWYEREANATASRWSAAGCAVLRFNRTHVVCSCTHLTEFAVMVPELRRPLRLASRWWLLAALLSLAAAMGALALWMLHRRHAYERAVRLGKREPRQRRVHGPPTYEQHVLRRQWRLRDSDADTLLADVLEHDRRTADGRSTLGRGSASTLAAGGLSRGHRTGSMASTVYDEGGVLDDGASLDDDEFTAERLLSMAGEACLANTVAGARLAPEQLRAYRHLGDERPASPPAAGPDAQRRRPSGPGAAGPADGADAGGGRRRSAVEPSGAPGPDGNIFDEPAGSPREDADGSRRATLLKFLWRR